MDNKIVKYSKSILEAKGFSKEAIEDIVNLNITNENYCDFFFLGEEEGALENVNINEDAYYIIGRDVLHNKVVINNIGEVFIYSQEKNIITFVNSSLSKLLESMHIGNESLCKVNMQQIENFEDKLRKIDPKALNDDDNYWIYEIESLVKLV